MALFENEDGVIYEYVINGNDDLEIRNNISFNKKEFKIPAYINGVPVRILSDSSFAKNKAEKIILPHTLREIGCKAFQDCENLKEITFPKTLEHIRCYAFEGCKSITFVDIPKTTSFEVGVFMNCSSLQITKMNKGICLPKETFINCPLKRLYLPETISIIFDSALKGVPKDMKIFCKDNVYVEKWAEEHGYKVGSASSLNSFLSEISDLNTDNDINRGD